MSTEAWALRPPQVVMPDGAVRDVTGGPRIGSLFSGYGGLDLGVQQVVGGDVAWHVEFDDAPSRILAHHWPGVPNYGDVTAVDWTTVEPVDVLTGGFPCQDVSLAGLRRGLRDGTRSGLWSEFARAIDVLRPGLVVIENVRGLLSATADRQMESSPWGVGDRHDGPALRALGAVLGDLAELGYDAEWCGLRAADAGAPHGRFRVFVVACPADADRAGLRRIGRLDAVGRDPDPRCGADGTRDAGEPASSVADADDVGGSWDRRARAGCAGSQDDDRAAQDAAFQPRAERRLTAPGQAEGRRSRADAGGRGGAPAADSDSLLSAEEHQSADFVDVERASVGWRPVKPAGARGSRRRAGWRSPGASASGRGASAVVASSRRGTSSDAERLGGERRRGHDVLAGSPRACEGDGRERERDGDAADHRGAAPRQWGPFGPAVERWERVTGRVAPAPTNADGRDGAHRLAPEFVEWMMGLPAGHVTGAPITRAQQLKALGNGVVPQQAALAVRVLLERRVVAA